MKWAEIHHLLRLFVMWWRELNSSVCLVNILTVMKCSKFLSNSLLCMLLRYNGKESINWLWFGSCWNVRLAYKYITAGEQHCFFDKWKFRLIIQTIYKTQLKLCISVIQTLTAFITCSSTPKAVKWTPRKTNIWKWCKLFLSSGTVFQEVTKEKGSGFCRKEEKMWHYLPFCFQLCGTESYWGSQKDAASSPPIQGSKNTVICI